MKRSEFINEEMNVRGWTARDLSKASGVAYTTIRSMLERDFVNASIDNTFKICRALGITAEELSNGRRSNNNLVAESSYPYIVTPISAGCAETVEAVTEESNITIPDSVMGKHAGNKDIRMMRVNGESMNRVIPDRSLIAVKKMPIEQIKDGDIVVYNDDYSYAVKRIYRTGDKVIFRPDSYDASFAEYQTTADEQLDIIGKVVVYIVELD